MDTATVGGRATDIRGNRQGGRVASQGRPFAGPARGYGREVEPADLAQRGRSGGGGGRPGSGPYIISNVGSFGENIYKIGLTRRLEPLDRIWELGDASVPFDFDVHAIILSEDAPALETRLHKHFLVHQVNKVNHRKEFFRASLVDIKREIEGLGIESKWTIVGEAREYRESLAIEQAIQKDPASREAWINRQLVLDPVGVGQLVEVTDDHD